MNEMNGRYQCPRCGMTFRVEKRPTVAADVTTCATPNCRVRFWHSSSSHTPARVGIEPQDYLAMFGEFDATAAGGAGRGGLT